MPESVRRPLSHLPNLLTILTSPIVSTAEDLAANMEETFRVNVVGPALVIASFRPLLQKSAAPRSIFISSGLGSIAFANDPTHPIYSSDWSSYRISKAALNMLVSQERKKDKETGVKTYVLCPGLVRSNLRGKEEDQVNAGGRAGDPKVSGRLVLDIMEGRREADADKFISGSGTYEW
jgi:NAD(P)-dependent dehydrogenase (short-subunit alcohol dehydrogenase family)